MDRGEPTWGETSCSRKTDWAEPTSPKDRKNSDPRQMAGQTFRDSDFGLPGQPRQSPGRPTKNLRLQTRERSPDFLDFPRCCLFATRCQKATYVRFPARRHPAHTETSSGEPTLSGVGGIERSARAIRPRRRERIRDRLVVQARVPPTPHRVGSPLLHDGLAALTLPFPLVPSCLGGSPRPPAAPTLRFRFRSRRFARRS